MKWQLDHWQQEALELNGKERQVRQELEQMVTEHLPALAFPVDPFKV